MQERPKILPTRTTDLGTLGGLIVDINQKLIHLLERIMSSSKGYCGDHYVYTPQLEADNINELHVDLVASQCINTQDVKEPCDQCGGWKEIIGRRFCPICGRDLRSVAT